MTLPTLDQVRTANDATDGLLKTLRRLMPAEERRQFDAFVQSLEEAAPAPKRERAR